MSLRRLSLVAGSIVSLLATPLTSVDTCSSNASRWDYWWYGSGPRYHCAEDNVCHLSHIYSNTIGRSYTWSESTTTGTTFTADYRAPETERLWIKQWFVVLDMTCQSSDTGLNVHGQHCDHACDPNRHVVVWVSCKDASGTEYQFSNADAQCDSSNHCQQN
ncbi:hypothetical protein NLG97_g3862 [Lecanicillium saksenae]|uniref:Uncharacterized protein n=1 Tax=Lecanicillium saksenae TaxID=468837 RepID=A0ACC1QYQ3_9HYPO|nr:hypothetical protein NLG97_g3862 [Lecanicillium saksenae]